MDSPAFVFHAFSIPSNSTPSTRPSNSYRSFFTPLHSRSPFLGQLAVASPYTTKTHISHFHRRRHHHHHNHNHHLHRGQDSFSPLIIITAKAVDALVIKTAKDFDDALASNRLHLCLIGMSNCGKSFRGAQLANHFQNCQIICIDDCIEVEIKQELEAQGYPAGIQGLADWMGLPHESRFPKNQQIYLDIEEKLTRDAATRPHHNLVLDTTGSVISLSQNTRDLLKQSFLVVYLEPSDDMVDLMIENFFKTPKPVVWGDVFQQKPGQTPDQAMRACYPLLLKQRKLKYEALAHVKVPAKISLSPQIDCQQFVQNIKDSLS